MLSKAAGERGQEVLDAYHPHELVLEAERPIRSYRDILREGLRRAAAARLGIPRVWVDRDRSGHPAAVATEVLPDMTGLVEAVERAAA
ncbi:MAG: hypothetical protein ACRDLQ_04200 [Solirubrobacterales bacterium]